VGQRQREIGGAIAVKFTLQPGEKKIVPMVIAWDSRCRFVRAASGTEVPTFYGTNGRASWAIARDGLLHAAEWSAAWMPGKSLTSMTKAASLVSRHAFSMSSTLSRMAARFGDAR